MSNLILVLFCMIFCHIVDDYYLQGILASMKQKSWWKDNVKDLDNTIYRHDYIAALICHAFSWSFMINLPMIVVCIISDRMFLLPYIIGTIIINFIFHAIVDHMKANLKLINLIADQSIHMSQILVTWTLFAISMSANEIK